MYGWLVRVPGSQFQVLGSQFGVFGSQFQVSGSHFRVPGTVHAELGQSSCFARTLFRISFGLQISDFAIRVLCLIFPVFSFSRSFSFRSFGILYFRFPVRMRVSGTVDAELEHHSSELVLFAHALEAPEVDVPFLYIYMHRVE